MGDLCHLDYAPSSSSMKLAFASQLCWGGRWGLQAALQMWWQRGGEGRHGVRSARRGLCLLGNRRTYKGYKHWSSGASFLNFCSCCPPHHHHHHHPDPIRHQTHFLPDNHHHQEFILCLLQFFPCWSWTRASADLLFWYYYPGPGTGCLWIFQYPCLSGNPGDLPEREMV